MISEQTDNLISDLTNIAPIGTIDKVDEKKIEDLGITPPSQVKSDQMVTMKLKILMHDRFCEWLDRKLGPPIMTKRGGVFTGDELRIGEGKFIRNLIDKHKKKSKKGIKRTEYNPNNVYIYAVEHPDQKIDNDGDCIVTVHTIGMGVNGIKIGCLSDLPQILAEEKAMIEDLKSQKYIVADEINIFYIK